MAMNLTFGCALLALLGPAILCAGPAFFLSTECIDGSMFVLGAVVVPTLLMFVRGGRFKEQCIGIWSWFYLYIFVLTFMMRETFIMAFGRIPCGFGMQPCAKQECSWYILGFICMHEECVEHVEGGGEYKFDFEYNKSIGWMLGALIPAWIAYTICVLHDAEWRWFGPPDRATGSYGKVILAVPVTYAACGLHIFRILMVNPKDDWASESTMSVAELYSALGLASFLELCMISLRLKSFHHGTTDDQAMRKESLAQCKLGVRIYLWSALILNGIQVAAKLINWKMSHKCDEWLPGMYSYLFPHSKLQLVGHVDREQGYGQYNFKPACADLYASINAMFYPLNFALCVVALVSLLSMQRGMEQGLRHIRPRIKFWAIKLALIVAFWMSFSLWILDITKILPQGNENRLFMSAYCVVAISPAFAIFHKIAYNADDFANLPSTNYDGIDTPDDAMEQEMTDEMDGSPTLLGKRSTLYGQLPVFRDGGNIYLDGED